jgi:hypothetical protein
MPVKQDGKSRLEKMLEGNTLEDKKKNAAEFVAPGGRGINDYSLEAPGIANNLRATAHALERVVKMLPMIINQHMEELAEDVKNTAERMEALQRKPPRQKLSNVRSICPTSISIGLILGFLLTIGVSWFWVIPNQIASQRGSDWGIAEYLATPAGKAVRQHYRKCKTNNTKGCELW